MKENKQIGTNPIEFGESVESKNFLPDIRMIIRWLIWKCK